MGQPTQVSHRCCTYASSIKLNKQGVSFCETSSTGIQGDNIEVIHDWPCQSSRNATQEKVPSQVAYREEGILWGSSIPSDVPRHMWTKLQLDNKQTGEAANKQADDVITDYLTQIKAHLIKNFDRKYGATLWRTMPITLVVTVPAVWSDLAKARTLEAVDKAGFNTRQFPQRVNTIITTEPEAAAIYTIKTLRGM
jgi:molecular chaperone DnaK (HSP70)